MQPFKGSRRGHSLTAASNFLMAVSTVSPAWARSNCSGQLGTSHFLKGSAGVPPAVSRILRDTSSIPVGRRGPRRRYFQNFEPRIGGS